MIDVFLRMSVNFIYKLKALRGIALFHTNVTMVVDFIHGMLSDRDLHHWG